MKRRGSVELKNISDRNDIKEDLMEGSRSLSSVLANKESKLDVSKNNLKGPSLPFKRNSDPYAVMEHGNQQNKIPVVMNCWNTERNYEVDL